MRSSLMALGVGLSLLCASGASQATDGVYPASDAVHSGIFPDGTPFDFHYLVQFWQDAGPGATADDNPNANAPGYVRPELAVFVHDKTISKAEAALIERKLTLVYKALLEQPSLKDVHGVSVMGAINIRRLPSGEREADLSISTRGINLANPKTLNKDGRYVTPGGEGPSLTIGFNKRLEGLTKEELFLRGDYRGIGIQQKGRNFIGYKALSPRPLTRAQQNVAGAPPYPIMNPDFFDTAARPSTLQLLTMKVGLSSFDRGFADGTHRPTSGVARLLAAAYTADWDDIVRRMEELR